MCFVPFLHCHSPLSIAAGPVWLEAMQAHSPDAPGLILVAQTTVGNHRDSREAHFVQRLQKAHQEISKLKKSAQKATKEILGKNFVEDIDKRVVHNLEEHLQGWFTENEEGCLASTREKLMQLREDCFENFTQDFTATANSTGQQFQHHAEKIARSGIAAMEAKKKELGSGPRAPPSLLWSPAGPCSPNPCGSASPASIPSTSRTIR